MATVHLPALVRSLCDDAALFPPGDAPMERAVREHLTLDGPLAELSGPFVIAAPRLEELNRTLAEQKIGISLTVPAGIDAVTESLEAAARIDGVTVESVEVPLAPGAEPNSLRRIRHIAESVTTYVEVPRDHTRPMVLEQLAHLGLRAKFRTGGLVAEAHPGEQELAEAITACVALGVAFKATAGLHHAVRRTDPDTHCEQHGFANILVATGVAMTGGSADEVAEVLAQRSQRTVGTALRDTPSSVRNAFVSFGTCSLVEPMTDLSALGIADIELTRPT